MADSVFDRLRRSKYGYVATGWSTFIDNLARNPDIAEVIKNDRDFFAHNEAVQSAKDVGKLRRAIKLAIGRAGAIAYMERQRQMEKSGENGKAGGEPEWRWQDFTSRVIDAGLSIPKGERHMWVLNCGTLKKGEKIKLPGTKEEYEVLAVDSGGAKISGLGYISAKTEALVWRPGTEFAEKRTEKGSPAIITITGSSSGHKQPTEKELEAMKAKKEKAETRDRKGKGETEMVKPSRPSAPATAKRNEAILSKPTRKKNQDADSEPNRWHKNDGEVNFRFGMPVRRGKSIGKVIRAHGSKVRVLLDDGDSKVEWSTEDPTIFWKDPIELDDEYDQGPEPAPKVEKAKTREPAAPSEADEDDEDDEIDPDDLPDDDDDLLAEDPDEDEEETERQVLKRRIVESVEDEDEDEEEDDDQDDDEDPESEEEDDGGEGDVEGDDKREYIYSGKDLEELAGVEYQRIQRLKANGVLDGTFLVADNGRVMYSFEAVDLVKNAPRNKPGRPPGGGKKRKQSPPQEKRENRAVREMPRIPLASDPRQHTIPVPAPSAQSKPTSQGVPGVDIGDALRGMKGHARRVDGKLITEIDPSQVNRVRTAADIFAETIDELGLQIVTRERELAELKKAMEALEGLAKRNR